MSPSAKILPFPTRSVSAWMSPQRAMLSAEEFLAIPAEERSEDDRDRYLGSPDVLLAICLILKRNRDLTPGAVMKEAVEIYRWIGRPDFDLGLFDERDYFLSSAAARTHFFG
jgi:hypothetical protein